MNFKVLYLDEKSKNYKFDLSQISESDWKFFLEDVVLNVCGSNRVRSILASVKVRDNIAKVKLAYQDGKYHEMVFNLDQFGVQTNGYGDVVSEIWQDLLIARFGKEYSAELNNKSLVAGL